MNPKRPPLTRMLAIDQYIRTNPFPDCSDLAEFMEVGAGVIHNDIEFMQRRLGAPLAYDNNRKGYYYVKDWALFPELSSDKKWEIPYEPQQFGKASPVPTSSSGSAEMPLHEGDSSNKEELQGAVAGLFKVRFSYEEPFTGTVSNGVLHPYHVHFSSHTRTWYLIAYCEKSCDVRVFDMDAFTSLRCLETHFRVKEGFSLDNYLSETFNEESRKRKRRVIISFSRKHAAWVKKKKWHPSQRLATERDGSITLTFEVASLEEVKQWVLHFGADAEVEEPEELRFMIKEELVRMGERYLRM